MKELINPLEARAINEEKKFKRLPEPVQMLQRYLEEMLPDVKCIVEDGYMHFRYVIKCPDFYEVTHFSEIFFDYNPIAYYDGLFYIVDGHDDSLMDIGFNLEEVKQIFDGVFEDSFEMKKEYDSCSCKNGKATRRKFRDIARTMSAERCFKILAKARVIAKKQQI